MDPRGWIPVQRSQGTLQCHTSLLQNAQQPLPGDVEGPDRLCKGRRVPAAPPLLLGPCGCCHTWPELRTGLVQRQPVLLPALIPEQWMLQSRGSTGLFPPLFPLKEQGGSPAQCWGGSCPSPSWVLVARGAGPDAGAHSRDAASASHQAAGAAGAVIDGLFISFSPAQDVSVRLRKIFLGLATPSILPRLLLPPGSSFSRPGGLKPVQTQGRRSWELLSHSPWFIPVGRAGLGSASLGMDQAKV